ncbi:hypothetical protein EGW08_007622 [Elysia chlorotica]|uniref:Calpain catalytic domain-containing protein n=1 Tax=Elysia chlorotica TaxID=188477 RepID=A0A433TSP5_ELYCH|nr:hypothetical protein EGW08_007622 [Elysia chlorotica]
MSFFSRIGDFKNDFDKYSGMFNNAKEMYDKYKDGIGGSRGHSRRRGTTTLPGRSATSRAERKNPFASLAKQDYEAIKKKCLEENINFEDPEFPAVDDSIFFSSTPPRPFEWKRPHEICDDPQWISDGASRFDVKQGELGDCWLLAAVASLTCNPKLFNWVVDPSQNFTDNYCGLFKFTFWHQGEWQEVVVDDRLPTYRNQLVFMHSIEKNEFWSALLEKAYAKLMGSYESLKGGSSSEAMEDFTGGVTEMFELQDNSPPNLLSIMLKAFERGSLMGCSIDADPHKTEAELDNGLIMGHAYSVTSVQLADVKTPRMTGQIPMVRIRNPWGNGSEWKGAWSDGSREWTLLTEDEKQELGLNFEDDGEFWMSFQDFTSNFQKLEICNLGPDSLDEEDLSNKKKWECHKENGSWIKRVNAGGCRNYLETFWTNPQFRMTLTDPDEDDDDNMCTALVAVLQKDRRKKRKEGLDLLTIGYVIYKLEDPNCGPLDVKYFKYHASVAKSPTFINMREVCGRHKLEPGTYAIIPSTFEPHYEGEFLIRIFTEKPNVSGEIDEDTRYEEEPTEADASWKHPTDLPGYKPPNCAESDTYDSGSNGYNQSRQESDHDPSTGPVSFDPGSGGGTDQQDQSSRPDPISERNDYAPNIPGPSYDQTSPGYGTGPGFGFNSSYGPGPGPDTVGYGPNPGFPGYGFNPGPAHNNNMYPGQSDYSMPSQGYGLPNPGYGQANPGYGQANPGYGQANPGYGQANSGYGQANSGYGQANSGYGQANSGYGQANSGYGPLNTGYGQPAPPPSAPGYGPPSTGFGPPVQGYGPPNPGYGQPPAGYNPGYPQPGYGQPHTGYGPPAPGIGFGPAYDPNYPSLTAASYYPALSRKKPPMKKTDSEVHRY